MNLILQAVLKTVPIIHTNSNKVPFELMSEFLSRGVLILWNYDCVEKISKSNTGNVRLNSN